MAHARRLRPVSNPTLTLPQIEAAIESKNLRYEQRKIAADDERELQQSLQLARYRQEAQLQVSELVGGRQIGRHCGHLADTHPSTPVHSSP